MAHRWPPVVVLVVVLLFSSLASAQTPVLTHDNLSPAGTLRNGHLELKLYAAAGKWRPESDSGTAVDVQAFGVEGGPLTTPGPLMRVPVGTVIDVSIHNTLPMAMEMHGMVSHPAAKDEAIVIEAGATRNFSFNAGAAGTYHYWATTVHAALDTRFLADGQLSGAFVVDEPGAVPDRILVLTAWFAESPVGNPNPKDPRLVYAINGKSWPHTSPLRYAVGEHVTWRVINLTETTHPMHLHGFYYDITAMGNGLADVAYDANHSQKVVTQKLNEGETMRLTWIPEREGNWLFHCHIVGHISPDVTVELPHAQSHQHEEADSGMRGLVVGITVTSPTMHAVTVDPAARAMTLTIGTLAKRFGSEDGIGLSLDGAGAMTPGPVLVLKRGEPVAITLKNALDEPASIHWHGMELESYFDGVAGFSGTVGSVTPAIASGGEFVARFTPPRAGTFMYHTHSHDETGLAKGLFGAIVVLEPGEKYDPAVDHVLILGLNGSQIGRLGNNSGQVLLNGSAAPTIAMKNGVPNRLRIINITANNDGLNVFLMNQLALGTWTLAAKDGAERTGLQRVTQPARQAIGVGEIYDFLYTPVVGPQFLEVRRASGAFLIQARVIPR